MNTQAEQPPQATNFLSTMQRHRGGALLEEASQKLAEVVAAVAATGKAGTMQITIAVKPASKCAGAVVLSDKVTAKPPVEPAPDSFWFATAGGALLTENPSQKQMFKPQAVTGGKVEEVPADIRKAASS